MGELSGYVGMVVAVIGFGTNYIPCRSYETYDGMMFQWIMSNGILGFGLCTQLAVGGEVLHLGLLGGSLWALSNVFVLPVVKILGLGVGFSLYHGVNLIVGYGVSRFGLFGAPVDVANIPELRDAATLVLLLSLVFMVRVEPVIDSPKRSKGRLTRTPSEDGSVPGSPTMEVAHPLPDDQSFRVRTKRRGTGPAAGGSMRISARPSVVDVVADVADAVAAAAAADMQRKPLYFAGPLHEPAGTPRGRAEDADEENGGGRAPAARVPRLARFAEDGQRRWERALAHPDTPRLARHFAGVGLALVAGVLAGVNAVPFDIWKETRGPDEPALSFLFAQTLGIYGMGSAMYIAYGAVQYLRGARTEKSPVRPAYLSGAIWACGFAGMLVAIDELGMGLAYVSCAIMPVMLSAVVSYVVFKEIRGHRNLVNFAVALCLQVGGVALLNAGS